MKTFVYVANGKGGGVYTFELDRDTGRLTERGVFMPGVGVAPLAASPDRRFLYGAVHSEPAAVVAFAVNSTSGALHVLNTVPVPASLTYLCVDMGGRFLLGASYGGDFLTVIPLGREGMLQPEPACHLRPGRNPHCILVDPSNRFAYAPLLGSDRIAQYRFDAATGGLAPNDPPFIATAREAGPRHLVLAPDNRHAYVLAELGGEILVCSVDRERGGMTPLHAVPLLPPDRALPPGRYEPPVNKSGGGNSPTPVMWAADIRITPDGRFVYASERTNSTLSIFRVDPVSGRLDGAGVVKTEKQPRGFAVDPLGRYLVAAGEKSCRAAIYAIDAATGGLSHADDKPVGSGPTWVEMLSFH